MKPKPITKQHYIQQTAPLINYVFVIRQCVGAKIITHSFILITIIMFFFYNNVLYFIFFNMSVS